MVKASALVHGEQPAPQFEHEVDPFSAGNNKRKKVDPRCALALAGGDGGGDDTSLLAAVGGLGGAGFRTGIRVPAANNPLVTTPAFGESARNGGIASTFGDGTGASVPAFCSWAGVVSPVSAPSVHFTRSISLSSSLDAYFANGSFEEALSLHRGCLQFGEMTNDLNCQSKACLDLGCIFERLGENTKALLMHSKSLELAVKAGNEERQGIAYNNMGHANFLLGRFAQALDLLMTGLETFKTIGDESKQVIAMGNIGCAQFSLGLPKEAVVSFEASLKLSETVEDFLGHATALGNLGNVFSEAGQHEDAVRLYFRQVGYMQKQLMGPTPVNPKQHLPQQYNALRAMLGDAFNNLAKVLSDNNQQTEAVLQAVRAIAFRQRIEEGQGDNDALRLVIFEQQETSYKILQSALLSLGRMGPAMAVAGLRKARALAHALGVVEVSDCTLFPFLAETSGPSSGLTEESEPCSALKAADEYLERKWHGVQHMSLAEGNTTRVLEFSFLEEVLVIWVVSSGELLCCTKVSSKGLGEEEGSLLSRVRKAMKVQGRDAMAISSMEPKIKASASHYASSERAKVKSLGKDELDREEATQEEALLRELYQALIAPVEVHLTGAKELLIVPHQALFETPWAALIDSGGGYLIEKHVIRITPSLHVGNRAAEARDEHVGHALIVGNPFPNSIGDLQGAEEEAKSIALIMQSEGIDVRLHITCEATKSRVQQDLQGATWAHLACHYDKDTNSLVLASAPHESKDNQTQLREERDKLRDKESYTKKAIDELKHAIKEAISQKQFEMALDLQAQYPLKAAELKEYEARITTIEEELQGLEVALESSHHGKNGFLSMEEVQGNVTQGLQRSINTGGKRKADDSTCLKSSRDVEQGVRMGIGSTVVLSACNSGRGEIKAEGVVGLCRSFLASGAAAAVVSLWSVEDRSTAALMEQMYTRLVDDTTTRLTVPQALRLAMLEIASRSAADLEPQKEALLFANLYQEWKRPMYWAGFIVVGASTRLPTRLK
jgi:CHAT domain-containing protein